MNAKMIGRLLVAASVCLAISIAGSVRSSAQAPKPSPCSAAEYRQFDFFLGDWDGFDLENPDLRVARNRVTRILDGCVLLEDYQGTDGSHGESFTIYDASRKVWHQTWATNRGALLVIEGRMQGNEIVLIGSDRTPEGKERLVRGVWKSVHDGVRETAVRSIDGGKTWTHGSI